MSDLIKRLRGLAAAERHMEHMNDTSWICDEAAVRLQQLEAKVSLECRWTKQILGTYDGYDSWSTSCGEVFAIAEEWHERLSTFCSHCGGKTVDVTPKDSEVGDE